MYVLSTCNISLYYGFKHQVFFLLTDKLADINCQKDILIKILPIIHLLTANFAISLNKLDINKKKI